MRNITHRSGVFPTRPAETLSEEAAVYIRIGIETSPKEMVPELMECGGMGCSSRWGSSDEA